jgi:transmembrane protein TMEM260 (protein O-mannosyltransferase)
VTGPSGGPPYRAALAVAGLVLAGYVLTLAPTVTFWDAGELIAAARTVGIPHPPGTPLFVLIAHAWAMLVPVGEYAVRTNLLSALLSALGAGFFFLVAHETLATATAGLEPAAARWLRLGGGAAAAVAGAFTFTNWQNSNETEVYAVATFSIAAMAWLVHVWRRHRGTERAPRLLLLVVYLAGVSIGNHLLALLVGPALIGFIATTLRDRPAEDSGRRREEWGQLAVVAGVWALLIGTGLGSTALVILGGICFVAAAAYAARGGAGAFAGLSLLVAGLGVTPYLYLYLRSAQFPAINEAAPATFDALLAVIRRAQYPPRTPLDDPTVAHGSGNPGRSLQLLGIQLLDYVVYFDWQWAKSLGGMIGPLPVRTLVTLGFASLGLRGSLLQRRTDRAAWRLLLLLFLITGLGLVAYMNFRPGYARWYEFYENARDHEVRERDYFFVVSFIVWGVWSGIGLAGLIGTGMARAEAMRANVGRLAPAILLLAAVPVALNWSQASRRQGADARLAADFAYDLLNSVPPYGILFTYGDNDTFPLWWAQEVEGIRRDVTVVCLALANTDWYMRQLRDTPTRPVDLATLPPVWRGAVPARPEWPLHSLTDSMIAVAMRGYAAPRKEEVVLGPITRTLEQGTVLYPSDILMLSLIQQNLGRRPVVWAITTGRSFGGLAHYVVQQGLGFRLGTVAPDTTNPALDLRRLATVPLDLPTTERLVYDTYRYAGLLEKGAGSLETTSAGIASSLTFPSVQLAYAYSARGDTARMERALDHAGRLSPGPRIRAALRSLAHPSVR